MTKKREHERVPMLGQLVGEVMVFEPMAVTQLSVKGLAVETRFPPDYHAPRPAAGPRSCPRLRSLRLEVLR